MRVRHPVTPTPLPLTHPTTCVSVTAASRRSELADPTLGYPLRVLPVDHALGDKTVADDLGL